MNPSLLTRLKDRWRAVDIDPYFWLTRRTRPFS